MSFFPRRKSIILRWEIPSLEKSSLSNDKTYLGAASLIGANAPNSLSIVC